MLLAARDGWFRCWTALSGTTCDCLLSTLPMPVQRAEQGRRAQSSWALQAEAAMALCALFRAEAEQLGELGWWVDGRRCRQEREAHQISRDILDALAHLAHSGAPHRRHRC